MLLRKFLLLCTLSVLATACGTKKGQDTESFLRDFHSNPQEVLNRVPEKLDENGNVVESENAESLDASYKIALSNQRDLVRANICGNATCTSSSGEQAQLNYPELKAFAETNQLVQDIFEIDKLQLNKGYAQAVPWSESYWPTPKGGIARRFGDPKFPDKDDWKINFDYFTATPPETLTGDALSPAEKYDLFFGDSNWTFTKSAWGVGQAYIEKRGYVPDWTGYCHGWSPASIVYPDPTHSVTVKGVTGTMVTFRPSDLRALTSALYGEAPPNMRYIGRRCRVPTPSEDEIGRVNDKDCRDTNPGSYHLALINRIGVQKRSFVFDASFDYEVWNYPIYGYKFSYFNPQTLSVSNSLHDSVIPIARFSIDKFKKYRSANAKFVVGIAVDLTYSLPGVPTIKEGLQKYKVNTVRYVYDLELDENKKIIDGEWYSNFHPDFIWAPPRDAKARSKAEANFATPVEWDGVSAMPQELVDAAKLASPERQPLGAVVETLMRMGRAQSISPQ